VDQLARIEPVARIFTVWRVVVHAVRRCQGVLIAERLHVGSVAAALAFGAIALAVSFRRIVILGLIGRGVFFEPIGIEAELCCLGFESALPARQTSDDAHSYWVTHHSVCRNYAIDLIDNLRADHSCRLLELTIAARSVV